MSPLSPGDALPEMTLLDDAGESVELASLQGKTVVLYFYPKDNTPGCTIQAEGLRDNWERFAARDDLVVFGVSPDGVASHEKFRARYDLPFRLLVDEDHQLAEELGLWVLKKFAGREYMGIQRGTVIVAPDGTISAIHHKVRPKQHVDLLTDALDLEA